MPFDAHKNLSDTTVLTPPSPATTGTSLVLATGGGALMPAVPFNATVGQPNARPSSTNSEIVRVTAIAGNTCTILRKQEGSTARAILVGDVFYNSITVKALTDIETPTRIEISANTNLTYATHNNAILIVTASAALTLPVIVPGSPCTINIITEDGITATTPLGSDVGYLAVPCGYFYKLAGVNSSVMLTGSPKDDVFTIPPYCSATITCDDHQGGTWHVTSMTSNRYVASATKSHQAISKYQMDVAIANAYPTVFAFNSPTNLTYATHNNSIIYLESAVTVTLPIIIDGTPFSCLIRNQDGFGEAYYQTAIAPPTDYIAAANGGVLYRDSFGTNFSTGMGAGGDVIGTLKAYQSVRVTSYYIAGVGYYFATADTSNRYVPTATKPHQGVNKAGLDAGLATKIGAVLDTVVITSTDLRETPHSGKNLVVQAASQVFELFDHVPGIHFNISADFDASFTTGIPSYEVASTYLILPDGTRIYKTDPFISIPSGGHIRIVALPVDAGAKVWQVTNISPAQHIRSKALPVIVAGDDQKFLKYNHATNAFVMAAAGSATWTEIEVDFGSGAPVYDAKFTITNAAITSTSKVIIMESGKTATGRQSGDAQWDSIAVSALPATGSCTVWCLAHPGPVKGKRVLQYSVS